MALNLVERAREIAEDLLFPSAMSVDAAERVPASHLDLLAAEGFYDLAVIGSPEAPRISEAFAGGCLATTFVWLQHQSALRGVARSDRPGVREDWFDRLCRGEQRAGVVQAALRPGRPALRARLVDGGYLLSGEAQWVTGWDMVDVLYTAVRDGETVSWLLVDAVAGPTLRVEPQPLVAVNASRTVVVRFDEHFVPASRLVLVQPYEGGQPSAPEALRGNGSLSIGLASRCATLVGSDELAAQVDAARDALDAALTGPPDAMPRARAAASALAMHAATLLSVRTGARAVLATEHAQRLVREATFLLVFGSRPAIRQALLDIVENGRPVRTG